MSPRLIAALFCAGILAGCGTQPPHPADTDEIAIFGINDFHGHIQSAQPIPNTVDMPDPQNPGKTRKVPAGGAAYLATELALLRKDNPHSIMVGVGDLIGASPLTSALLDDEPTFEVLNRLGLSVSVVGNHEFDAGRAELERRIAGKCPEQGCKLPGFRGARFDYLAANVIDSASGKPFLPSYVIREIDGVKVAFIGTPLHEIPDMVVKAGISTLRFEDEVQTINALVPEIHARGAHAIVALVHQGGQYEGGFNDPTYRCDGLKGPIVDIAKALDKSVAVVMSAHTHNAYTCKIDGRLLTQGYSYGALVSEVKLKIDRQTGAVVAADATNHVVDQSALTPDADMQRYVNEVAARTEIIRNQVVGRSVRPLTRKVAEKYGDSALGNLVADTQLAYAKRFGAADLAITNSHGIRADLPANTDADGPVSLTFGDLFAAQPFGNQLVVAEFTGAQILEALRDQWQGADDAKSDFLQISKSLAYRWKSSLPVAQRIVGVTVDGKPLDPKRTYRIVLNSFLAGGGDSNRVFAQGRNASLLPGKDIDALRWFLESQAAPIDYRSQGRIVRED